MDALSILLLALVALWIFFALRHLRKNGACGCGGNSLHGCKGCKCDGCAHCGKK